MQLGLVVGTAHATIKHGSMEGWRLLVVQPYAIDGVTPDGEPLVAVDGMGAGRGQRVILTSDGRATRELLGSDATPVRWSVMGVED